MRWTALLLWPLLCCALNACAPARSATWTQSPLAPDARSVESRPLQVWTRRVPNPAPRVLIIAAIHGDEPEALAALPALRTALAHAAASIDLVENANPDGVAHHTRTNAHGVDLNRNWPTANFAARTRHGTSPLSEPESRFLFRIIREFQPDAIIVFHSARNGPFVNYDGPAEHLAEAFAHAAQANDPRWHVRASMGYPTPGSLGTWAGIERNIPILTVELARSHDPALVERALIEGVIATLDAVVAPHTDHTPRSEAPRTRSSELRVFAAASPFPIESWHAASVSSARIASTR